MNKAIEMAGKAYYEELMNKYDLKMALDGGRVWMNNPAPWGFFELITLSEVKFTEGDNPIAYVKAEYSHVPCAKCTVPFRMEVKMEISLEHLEGWLKSHIC